MNAEFFKDIIRAAIPRSVRNWLRSPSRSTRWIADAAMFAFGHTKTLIVSPDWSLVCHPSFYRVVHGAQIADAEQAQEFRAFLPHCSKGMFLYDVGAHFGIFSLAAAHFGGKSLAVDPSPTAIRMIGVAAALNECTNNIQILRAAVSDSEGTIGMLSSGVFSDGYFRFASGRPHRELTPIQAVTIDGLMPNFGPPTHLKIDVEGHEAAVLRGARTTLLTYSPMLFIELHNELAAAEGVDPRSALQELEHAGYVLFDINSNQISEQDILGQQIVRVIAIRQ